MGAVAALSTRWVRLFRMMRRLFLFLLALFVFSASAAVAQHAPGSWEVLRRAQAASGGAAAWNAFRGLHETGTEDGVSYERWLDGLRYGDRLTLKAPGGERRYGYNGSGAWWRPVGSGTWRGSEIELLRRARSEAFFGGYAYYFQGRFDLRSGFVGERQSGGQAYTVIWVHPSGGEPRDLWFDRKTGLLARMVDRTGDRPRTVELSDYRKVGKLLLPFKQVMYGGELTKPRERRIEKIEAVTPDRALFSLPR